jgi:hypothetical protein
MRSYYERRKSITELFKLSNLPLKFPLRQEEQVVQNIIDETPVEDLLKDIENLKKLKTKCFLPTEIMRFIYRIRPYSIANERNW